MSLLVKAMQSKIFSFTLPYKNSTYLEDDQFLRNRKKMLLLYLYTVSQAVFVAAHCT